MKIRINRPIYGVPLTFLEKYCPEQFEIVALGNGSTNFTPTKEYINPVIHRRDGTESSNASKINGECTIEVKEKPQDTNYYTSDNSSYLIAPFSRILIRRKV